jgi:hypothetical protein
MSLKSDRNNNLQVMKPRFKRKVQVAINIMTFGSFFKVNFPYHYEGLAVVRYPAFSRTCSNTALSQT